MQGHFLLALALLAAGCTCSERHDFDAGVDAGPPPARDAGPPVGFDAGLPPDPEVVTTCAEALSRTHHWPCDFEGSCDARDGCCTLGVSCDADGELRRDPIDGLCEAAPEPSGCAPHPATLAGESPLGPIDFGFGVASHSHAFAVNARLYWSADEDFAACGSDRLSVFLTPRFDADPPGRYVGAHDATALLVVGGEMVAAPATIEVSEEGEDDHRLVATVRVDAPGWDLRGTFDAPPCDALDRSGP